MGDEEDIINFHMYEGGHQVYSAKIFLPDVGVTFVTMVLDSLCNHALWSLLIVNMVMMRNNEDDPIEAQAQAMLGRVTSVKCFNKLHSELFNHLQHSNLYLQKLNSLEPPIFKNGINVYMAPEPREPQCNPLTSPFDTINPLDVIMGKAEQSFIKFLPYLHEVNGPTLDHQIKAKIIKSLKMKLVLGLSMCLSGIV